MSQKCRIFRCSIVWCRVGRRRRCRRIGAFGLGCIGLVRTLCRLAMVWCTAGKFGMCHRFAKFVAQCTFEKHMIFHQPMPLNTAGKQHKNHSPAVAALYHINHVHKPCHLIKVGYNLGRVGKYRQILESIAGCSRRMCMICHLVLFECTVGNRRKYRRIRVSALCCTGRARKPSRPVTALYTTDNPDIYHQLSISITKSTSQKCITSCHSMI